LSKGGRIKLKKGDVYLLVGEERFFKDEFLKTLKGKVLSASNKELNFASFSAKGSRIEAILENAKTLPFLSEKRIVVIKDVEKLNEKAKGPLLSFLKNPPETTSLVLESDIPLHQNKFLGSLAAYTRLIKTPRLHGASLVNWIKKIASSFNKSITGEAIEILAEFSGNDLKLLSTELEKIVSFIGEKKEIAPEDIEKIAGRSLKDDVFILVDYISKKDASKALLLCRRLILQGKRPHEIIGLIGWHLRKVLSAKLALEKGKTLVRPSGFRSAYTDRFNALLNNFKTDEVREKLKLLFKTDRTLKTTSAKSEFIMDVLVSRLCAT
jgi:DNA polymerase-3 subunit delta